MSEDKDIVYRKTNRCNNCYFTTYTIWPDKKIRYYPINMSGFGFGSIQLFYDVEDKKLIRSK